MLLLQTGLSAAKPEQYLKKYIKCGKLVAGKKSFHLSKYDSVWLVSVGKAADVMAKFVHRTIHPAGGVIIVPQNYTPRFLHKHYRIIKAGHPTPNKNSTLAAKAIILLLQNAKKNDLVLFLISGGASSLVCAPDGISLEQKKSVTQELLKSGASISEINTIRKHLSRVKGGKILENLHCDAISYVISDVIGDDLGSIGSGLVYCDKSTFSECLDIIDRYGLGKKIPKKAIAHLRAGAHGKIAETPKKPKIPNVVIANNSVCVDMIAKKSRALGYDTKTIHDLSGDVEKAANKILRNFSFRKKSCLVFGGETTVRVTGDGRGGRNQELVLRILRHLKQNAVVASIGTDGIDGNTKHAGAIFDHIIPQDTITPYLKNNDSNSFFAKFGGLIMTGPTHSNLLDVGLVMVS